VLRILYAWLEEEEEIDASPMAKMRPPIVPEQPVPIVPEDGLRRLLAACAGKHFEGSPGHRDRDVPARHRRPPGCAWPTST
jgi:hypothetical protein